MALEAKKFLELENTTFFEDGVNVRISQFMTLQIFYTKNILVLNLITECSLILHNITLLRRL